MNVKLKQWQITRERWIRGLLGYKEHAGQNIIRQAFEKSNHQLFVGECARQFGKTIFEAILALECAFRNTRAKIKIGTAFHTDLIEFILPAFEIVMEDCPDDLRPVWKSQQSKFVLPHNGSEIKLVGLDRKPNGLRGTVIDLIILSEAGFISNLHYLFKSVIIPATTHRPDCRVVMLSTPPDTPAHEFLDYVAKAQIEGGYILLTIYDNPLIDETTIARLMKESGGANSTTWRREYLCEHITDANLAIISGWKREYIQDIPHDEFFPFYHKYHAMDLGVRDNTAAILGYYDFKRAQLVVEHEFVMNGPEMNTRILQANLKRKELTAFAGVNFKPEIEVLKEDMHIDEVGILWKEREIKVYRRISDNNNPLMNQDLSFLHHMSFMPTDKGRLEEMVNTAKILVSGGGLIVHPRCIQMAGCLEYGVWDSKRQQFARSNVFGHFDALAALIYKIRNLDRTTDPIPHNYGFDRDNQIIFPYNKNAATVRNLARGFGLKK